MLVKSVKSNQKKLSQNTYYQENVVKILAKKVESYKSNPEKQQALSKSSYRANPDKFKALSKKTYRANPDKFKALSQQNYKANTDKYKALFKMNYRDKLKALFKLNYAKKRDARIKSFKTYYTDNKKTNCANERNKYVLAEPKLYVKEQYLKEIQFNLSDDPIAWLELLCSSRA